MQDFTKEQALRWIRQEAEKAETADEIKARIASECRFLEIATPEITAKYPVSHRCHQALIDVLEKKLAKIGAPPTAAAIFFKDAEQMACNLWGRWQDEKEYEDINDYRVPLEKIASPLGVEILAMTKSPFGCKFKTADGTYALKVTSRAYSYAKVA